MKMKSVLKSLLLFSCIYTSVNSEVITNIKITGNNRIDEAAILERINKGIGDDVDDNDLNELVKQFNKIGLFSRVNITTNKKGKLTIQVEEYPIVSEVRFKGNKKLKTDDIQKALKDIMIKKNEVLSPNKIKTIQLALLEMYKKMNIYNATVNVKIVKQKNDKVAVEFEISENNPTTIKQIIMKGNDTFTTSDLKRVILSKAHKWFNFLATDDKYDSDRISVDKQRIEHYYKKNGFAQAEVKRIDVELNKERTGVIITFTINEGQVFKFGNIKLKSNIKNLDVNKLKYKKRCKKGKNFNIDLLALEQTDIIKEINKKGFVAINIDPEFTYNKDTKTVDILLNIKETEKKYISKIIIKGNDKTRDNIVRREFPFEEGDLCSQSLLDIAKSNLFSTGFFDGVDVSKHQDPISPDKCIVEANVVEARTGSLNFSGSYSTLDGPMTSFGYSERNFLGTGKAVSLSVNSGRSLIGPSYGNDGIKLKRKRQFEILKSASFSIQDSHLFGRDLTGGISLFKYTSAPFDNFLLNNYGVAIDLSYLLGDRLSQSWEFGLSRRIIDHVDVLCSPLIKAQLVKYDKNTKSFKMNEPKKGTNISLQTALNYSYPIYEEPFKGLLNLKWVTAFSHCSGFDSTIWKNIFSFMYSKQLTRNVALNVQASYGRLTPIGKGNINLIDSFTTNVNSVRGFDEGSCCPHFVTTRRKIVNNVIDNKEKPLVFVNATGAKNFMTGTISFSRYITALPSELNCIVSLFGDVGYYWGAILPNNCEELFIKENGYEEITYNKNKVNISKASCEADSKLNKSSNNKNGYKLTGHDIFETDGFSAAIGIGVSFNTPFGPVTISIAVPIKKSIFDNKRLFNFGTSVGL